MRPSTQRWVALVLTALLSATAATATATARPGITQAAGRAGCLAAAVRGCPVDPLLRQVGAVAVSPDGRSVFAAMEAADTVAVLDVDRTTGALRRRACVARVARAGCSVLPGLDGPSAVVAAPGGRDVYVAARAGHRILHFRRAADRGLSYAGCTGADAATGCATVHPRLTQVDDLGLAAGGRILVATDEGYDSEEGPADGGIVTLARDAADGTLTPVGCLVVRGRPGCPGGDVLAEPPLGPAAVAAAGPLLYLPSVHRLTAVLLDPADGRPALGPCFAGQLRGGCGLIAHLGTQAVDGVGGGLSAVALDATGRYLSTAGFDGRLPQDPIAILTHATDPATGRLAAAACLKVSANEEVRSRVRGCRPGRPPLNGVSALAVSPDGRRMVALDTAYDLVSVLVRNPVSGDLGRVSGKTGCVGGADAAFGDDALDYPHRSCATGRGFAGSTALSWGPDGRAVFLATARGIVVLRVR